MSPYKPSDESEDYGVMIHQFVEGSSGLRVVKANSGDLQIHQKVDGKHLTIVVSEVEDVISRMDTDGHHFLQVNYVDGRKLLLTEKLVGFKPLASVGLDMNKLPKVVTTPDLISVVEAIEESLNSEQTHPVEVDVLRKVFSAVIDGGEAIGFDLNQERAWLKRLTPVRRKASA